MSSLLLAGFGQREITPDHPVPLAGFDLRKGPSEGVHDPLFVRALLLTAGGESVLLLEADLLGTSDYLCDRIRNRVREALAGDLDLKDKDIQIGAIHTHAAPQSVFRAFDCYEDDYLDTIAELAAEAARDARADLHLVRAGLTEDTVEEVGCFRDSSRAESLFAMPVRQLWLLGEAGESPMVAVLFCCHPTVLNEQNRLISRDLLWGAEESLKKRMSLEGSPMPRVLWMNGACADISTRYTRRESTFEEARRLGSRMAESLRKPEEAELTGNVTLKTEELMLRVPPARFFTKEERREILAYLEEKIEACPDAAQKREYIACRSVLQRPHYGEGQGTLARLSLLEMEFGQEKGSRQTSQNLTQKTAQMLTQQTVQKLALVGVPFEYAQKDAVRLSGRIAIETGKNAWIRCYAGGYEGYLPSGKPLTRDSGYEDMASGYASEAKELLAAAVLDALKGM